MARPLLFLAALGAAQAAAPATKVMSDGRTALSQAALTGALPAELPAGPIVATATAPLPGLAQLLNRALGCALPEVSTFREMNGLEVSMGVGASGIALAGAPGFRKAGEALSAADAGLAQVAARCADGLVLDLLAEDLDGPAPALAAALGALSAGAKGAKGGKPVLIFLVRGGGEGAAAKLDQWLQGHGLAKVKQQFGVEALGIAAQPTEADAAALKECLATACTASAAGPKAVAARVFAACGSAEGAASVALPGFEEIQAMGNYAAAKAADQLARSLRPHRMLCEKGKVVKNFGDIAAAAKKNCLESYSGLVAGLAASMPVPAESALEAAYANGRAAFEADMETSIRRLEALQLVTLAGVAEKELQKALLKELRAEGTLPRDRQAALVRQVLFDFAERAKPILAEGAQIFEQSYAALEERLGQVASRFLETPKAQIVSQTRQERGAKRQRAAKGERSIKPRLDFVSMLNVVGAGGLEGFGSFQAGALNFILGFQNGNEGDEPLFMIQPKLHLDVSI